MVNSTPEFTLEITMCFDSIESGIMYVSCSIKRMRYWTLVTVGYQDHNAVDSMSLPSQQLAENSTVCGLPTIICLGNSHGGLAYHINNGIMPLFNTRFFVSGALMKRCGRGHQDASVVQ
jgi:hypothetical protein